MKTQALIAALILMLGTATSSLANSSKNILTFSDAFGRSLHMPSFSEEANDAIPFDAREEFHKARLQDLSHNIDLSQITIPEAEVEDTDIDLKSVFESLNR